MINISDHHTRMRANYPNVQPMRVMGCLLGSQTGRTVDISNSFEMNFSINDQGALVIDHAFLVKKQEQCKHQLLRAPSSEHPCSHYNVADTPSCLQTRRCSPSRTWWAGTPLVQLSKRQTWLCTRRWAPCDPQLRGTHPLSTSKPSMRRQQRPWGT